ncbi:MAG: ATP-binding protein [Rhodocyclaceae bacterium]|nr:ATP-binding protein [Rhodocyclaceae bacterium]MDZ4213506.1 ATP-binding protein [Rhodocyclaceae bacterium]
MSIAAPAPAESATQRFRYRAIPDETLDESLWRSLGYFSYYRLIVAGVFLGMSLWFPSELTIGGESPKLFLWTCVTYLSLAVVSLGALRIWRQAFGLQLTLQVAADILLLTLLLYASGGGKSGIAMMILVVLVGAGLVGQGRMVLFYAAFATLVLLFEQAYRVVQLNGDVADFFRTGLTSIGFFGSAIAARLLARRVVANEELARKRGIELADQIHINERVIRDMQDGVLVVDAVGRVRQANPQALMLLGLNEPPPTMLANYAGALVNEYLTRRSRGVESEMVLRLPRTGRVLRVRFLPPGEGGNALVFLEDMSKLEQEAQQLKLAALGRLTANLAHEIRNPLAAISQAAELLGETPDGQGATRLTRMIGDNVGRLNRLVSEVMELGRRDRARPEQLVIGLVIESLLEELSLQDPAVRQRVTLDLPAELSICFDRGHFHRVLTNLVGNALQHASPATGAVRVVGTLNEAASRVDIDIIDDGPGIDVEARGKVFEPFFTTRATGTGLGLYIARELSEANGARLVLRENAPGAHFCLSCASTCQFPAQDDTET